MPDANPDTPCNPALITPSFEYQITQENWHAIEKLEEIIEQCVASTCRQLNMEFAPESEISLLFCSDDEIAELNGQYRNKPIPTNVLSLPTHMRQHGKPGPLLGDIIMAYGVITSEAREATISFENHLAHLMIHGFLHLLGFDHQNNHEALIMEEIETRILHSMDIASPYG